ELREVVNGKGEIYRREIDARGNLTREVMFDGQDIRYAYDGANRLTSTVRASGQRVSFEYDLAGQLIKRTLPDGDEETREYDALGTVTAVRRGGNALEFVLGAIGRVLIERQTVDGETFEVITDYDPDGSERERRSSLGHVERVRRDASGRILDREF